MANSPWVDKYRPASFRGVPFRVAAHDASPGGRRVVQHLYPKRDTPYAEDMGRVAKEYPVDAYVIAPDYYPLRDALIAACNKSGPGQLVHPYFGSVRVVCTQCRVTESTEEGGLARLSLVFVEAGRNLFPQAILNAIPAIDSVAQSVRQSASASVSSGYDDDAPNFALEETEIILQDMATAMIAASGQAGGTATGAAAYDRTLRGILGSPEAAVRDAQALSEVVEAAVTGLGTVFGLTNRQVLREYRRVGSTFGDLESVTAAANQTTAIAERNNKLLIEQIRAISLAEAARVSLRIRFETRNDAEQIRDELALSLQAVIETTTDTDLYRDMAALRTELLRRLPGEDHDLPSLIEYTPAQTLPSLVIAQRLYGDATRADEIVSRNAVAHPGFVPGGRALEVLTDAG